MKRAVSVAMMMVIGTFMLAGCVMHERTVVEQPVVREKTTTTVVHDHD